MATVVCTSYKRELLAGVHSVGDTYRLALYGADAALGTETREYAPAGEVTGPGYEARGVIVSGLVTSTDGNAASLSWTTKAIWTNATFSARYGLLYNETKDGRAVAVADFGKDEVAKSGTMTVVFPDGPLITLE